MVEIVKEPKKKTVRVTNNIKLYKFLALAFGIVQVDGIRDVKPYSGQKIKNIVLKIALENECTKAGLGIAA